MLNAIDGCVCVQHEQYVKRDVTVSDDIAILTLASPIYANGVTIQYAKLPENNDDLFVGREGVVTGWGRIGENLFLFYSVFSVSALHKKLHEPLFICSLNRNCQVY